MDKPVDLRIEEKLRGLCKQVSVANSLDEEVREELFGHMEDKLLAYLSGEEPVAEDDAFILVREHFGDPGVVKGMLREVHAREAGVSLGRRLLAALTLTLGLGIGFRLFFSLFILGAILQGVLAPSPSASAGQERPSAGALSWGQLFPMKAWSAMESVDLLASLLAGLACIAGPLIFWYALRRWDKKAETGQPLWFGQWPFWRIGLFVLLLWGLVNVFPQIRSGVNPGFWEGMVTTPVLWTVAVVLSCVVWFWWADRPPRRAVNLLCAGGMFFLSQALIVIARLALPTTSVRFNLSQDVFYWMPSVSWAPLTSSPDLMLNSFKASASTLVEYGLAALALYLVARECSKRLAPKLWGRG